VRGPDLVDNSWVVPPIPVVALALGTSPSRNDSAPPLDSASPVGSSPSLARRDLVERGDGSLGDAHRGDLAVEDRDRTVAVSTARSRRSASA